MYLQGIIYVSLRSTYIIPYRYMLMYYIYLSYIQTMLHVPHAAMARGVPAVHHEQLRRVTP